MLQYVDCRDITALDVGCGTGNFGLELKKEKNAIVWGVEINREVADIAESKLDKVLCGDAADCIARLPDATFDLICFNDSLEHLIWPDKVLKICRKKLKEGGRILCSVPNVRYFRIMFALVFNKEFEYTDAGILDRTHMRFFTIKSIADLFRSCGYKIEIVEGNQSGSTYRPKSWRYKVFQIMTLGRAEDMRHSQIHVLAGVKD